jgi:hypothetical protein
MCLSVCVLREYMYVNVSASVRVCMFACASMQVSMDVCMCLHVLFDHL